MRCLYLWWGVVFLIAAGGHASAEGPVATPSFWSGIRLKAKAQGEVVSNLTGGLATGSVGNVLFVGGLSWDSKSAGAWKGGKVVVNFLAVDTGNPEAYVGDVQGVSNLTTPDSLALSTVFPATMESAQRAARSIERQ